MTTKHFKIEKIKNDFKIIMELDNRDLTVFSLVLNYLDFTSRNGTNSTVLLN